MDKRFFDNLGDAVKKTAKSRDLTDLGHNLDDVVSEVRHTVQNLMEQVPEQARRYTSQTPPRPPQNDQRQSGSPGQQNAPPPGARQAPPPNPSWNSWATGRPQNDRTRPDFRGYDPRKKEAAVVNAKPTALVRKPSRGNGLGILLTTLGSVFIPIVSLLLIGFGIACIAEAAFDSLVMLGAVLLPCLALGVLSAGVGSKLRARFKRCKRYLRLAGNAKFVSIEQLSLETGKNKAYVVEDLQRMIQKKFIPYAHLDDQKTCLMLDSEIYKQYLASQQSLKARQEEEEKRRKEREADPKMAELYDTVKEGQGYIRQIKEANDAIPNEDISEQLSRLENVATRIFAYVEKNPAKLPEIRKFMHYYLPTTLKLVNAYRSFEAQPVQGDNIRTAKQEIQNALSTINEAYANLLDSLFEDDALDISTDISVLQSMLTQEGLTESDFTKNN